MTSPIASGLEAEVVDRGVSDWISFAELQEIASDLGAADTNSEALGFIDRMIGEDRIRVGNYDRGFNAWSDTREGLARRVREYLATSAHDDPLGPAMSLMIDLR